MPELPEVETVARELKPKLIGQKISAARVLDPRLALKPEVFVNKRVQDVFRLGKQIVLRFGEPQHYLAVHLRMTGRLLYEGATDRTSLEYAPKALRASWQLDKGELLFCDTRRFGTLEISDTLAAFQPHGIDPLSIEFTPSRLEQLRAKGTQAVKPWLLRQDKIVGLGNIYASEILFAARIDPFTSVATLTRNDLHRIHRQTIRILRKAIENCGTTFSDFQNSSGSIGSYQAYLKVYGRDGEECKRCRKSQIEKVMQLGRSTFFCAYCQGSARP